MRAIHARLVELEKDIQYRSPAGPGEPDFRYVPGRLDVLLSAPHGAAHRRNLRLKEEDEFTAGFARLVGELSGAHVLYTRRMTSTDSNYDRNTPYKLFLKEIVHQSGIRFVVDIHGASRRHGFGIALGTMQSSSCPAHYPVILQTLARHGFLPDLDQLHRLDLDNLFKGGGGQRQETITRYCSQVLGIPAAQFELHPWLRSPLFPDEPDRLQPVAGKDPLISAVEAFVDLVHALSAAG